MKGLVFFAIIYIVNSVQITSFASVTSIPINKVYPSPSSIVYPKPSASSRPSTSGSARISASTSAQTSHNTTLYKMKLTENQKIITIENQKIENKKIDVNTEIKKYEEKKIKINYKFITIFFVFIVMIFGYSIYKCIYIINNAKPKKVENGLPFYNNKYIDMNDNNIYHLQPHSPKNYEQCYRRISSNSSISNMESF